MAFPKKCTLRECPYHADRGEVPYDGPVQTDILVVGESPGFEENKIGRPFSGISGRFLMALLRHIGKERSEVLLTNACRCRIDKDKDSIKNQNLALKTCRTKLAQVIHRVKPKVIIALGGVALRQLTGMQKIMENRGKFFHSEEFDCQIFATVHPAWILRQGARDGSWDQPVEQMSAIERLLFMDFEQVQKFLGSNDTGIDTTQYVQGKSIKQVRELEKAEVLAIDFETTGLNIEDPSTRILSIGFSAEEGKSIVFLPKKDGTFPKAVLELLSHPTITKIVAARPFEERCAKKLGYPMPGNTVQDVLSLAHVLDENFQGGYSLEKVADLYTNLKNIKSLARGMRTALEELDKAELVKYNGVDCDATLRAFHVMRRMLGNDPVLANYYTKFTQRVQTMFADLHHNGCLVDTTALGKGERELEAIALASEQDALKSIPASITTSEKHEGKLRLSRDALIRDYLFTHPDGKRLTPNPKYLTPKKKEPQITEDHLKQFRGRFIDNYLRNKKAKKILSTYLKKLWVQMRNDGRVYPDTIFTRTVTGRTVMINPAIQTIPQRGEFAKHVKKAFVADPGWVMMARDLAQSEIRIVGWLAQDPNILGALAANVDVHTKTAAVINKVPIDQVTKDMRQKAKACIAEGQLVSVKDPFNGEESFVEIQKVRYYHRVWDGQAWVHHDGVIFQGEREVITYDGLTATPDHTVFLEAGGHCGFEQAKAEVRGIAIGDAAFEAFRNFADSRQAHNPREAPENTSPVPRLWKDKFPVGRQRTLWKDEELPLSERGEIRPGSSSRCVGRPVRCDSSENLQSGEQVLPQLRWEGDKTEVQVKGPIHKLVLEALTSSHVQRHADRPTEQRRALRTGESPIGFSVDEPHEQADERESSIQGDFDQCESFVARDQGDAPMVPLRERVDEQTGPKEDVRGVNPEHGEAEGSRKRVRVYDIRNAGPRHRFTVQGKVVSNCTARGELVLTDHGLVPIENVTVDMKVWDGLNWVNHCGIIYQGEREVVTYEGLTATPDHYVVLTDGRAVQIGEAASSMEQPRLAIGEVEGSPVDFHKVHWKTLLGGEVPKDQRSVFPLSPDKGIPHGESAEGLQQGLYVPEKLEIQSGSSSPSTRRQIRRSVPEMREPQIGTLEELRRPGDSVLVQKPGTLHPMDSEAFTTQRLQEGADRQGGQRWIVPTGKPSTGNTTGEPLQQENQQTVPVLWYTGTPGTRVASAEDGFPSAQSSPRDGNGVSGQRSNSGANPQEGPRKKTSVYDLVNAGPLHRFTVSGKLTLQCNFGFIYGMSAKKFQSYAKDEYGINLSIDQCEAVRQAFFAHPTGYYKLMDFHRKQENEAVTKGYVRSPIGRLRRLPNAQQWKDYMAQGEALRQGINFPVQSFSSDLGLIGMYLFWLWVKKNNLEDKIKVMWFIHDAVVFQARADVAPRAMKMLKYCMEQAATKYMKKHFDLEVGYPVASDGKAGSGWATLEEYCDKCESVKMRGTCPKCREIQRKKEEDDAKKVAEAVVAARGARIRRTLVIN